MKPLNMHAVIRCKIQIGGLMQGCGYSIATTVLREAMQITLKQ